MHCWARLHELHVPPAIPHASGCVPAWQVPAASQHPVAQVEAEHTGLPQPTVTTEHDSTAKSMSTRMSRNLPRMAE